MCRLPRFAARVSGGGQVRDAGRAVELGLHVARDAAAVVFVAPRDELVSRCPHDERIAASILAQRKQHASTASRANTIPPRESRPRQFASIVLTAKVAHRGLLWHRPVCKARVATPRPTRLAARWVVIRGPMDPPPAPRAPTWTPYPQTPRALFFQPVASFFQSEAFVLFFF